MGFIPTPAGIPHLLGAVFPEFAATDAGKALALWLADIGNALLAKQVR